MKRIIFLLVFSGVFSQLIARQVSKTETSQHTIIEEYADEADGLIKRVYHQKTNGKTFIEEFYKNNPGGLVKKEWYNRDAETKLFDKQISYYSQESEKDYRESVIKTINGKRFFYTTFFFKPSNKFRLKTVTGLYTYKLERPIYNIYNYLEETSDMLIETSFEYDDNNKVSKFTQKFKNRTDKAICIEEYYSYPEFSFEEFFSNSNTTFFKSQDSYRQQIVLFDENKTGLIKQINTRNPDGTCFKEYFIDTHISNTQFNILRDKYDKDGNYIFEEQIYEEEPLYGKVHIYHMDIGDDEIIINEIYYDKDGNEIPESELGISE